MRQEQEDFNKAVGRIILSDRARAQVLKSHIERTIATAWDKCKGDLPCDEAKASNVIDALKEAGYEIVPRTEEPARVDFAPRKEIELAPGNVVRLTPEGEAAIRAFVQSVPLTQDAVSAGIEALEHSLDCAEVEVNDWGMREHGANDLARRYSCRVTVSGRDDPRNPNSYEADDGDHAVVAERLTGRLVGLTECWYLEDGDPIVPKTWLEAVLLAWEAKAKALRESA